MCVGGGGGGRERGEEGEREDPNDSWQEQIQSIRDSETANRAAPQGRHTTQKQPSASGAGRWAGWGQPWDSLPQLACCPGKLTDKQVTVMMMTTMRQ